jgi:cytochrome c556
MAMAVIVGAVANRVGSQEEPAPKIFMRSKLEHSQKLLEALAVEDFAGMAKDSQALSLLSLAASWQVLQTPEYAQQSLEFRRSADALTEAARKKNLDGAALAYVQMTMKCVSCHKYVRGVRMAAAPLNNMALATY